MPKNTVENHAFQQKERGKRGSQKKKKKIVGRKQKPLRQSGETSPQGVRRFFRELLVSNHKVRGEKGVSDKYKGRIYVKYAEEDRRRGMWPEDVKGRTSGGTDHIYNTSRLARLRSRRQSPFYYKAATVQCWLLTRTKREFTCSSVVL